MEQDNIHIMIESHNYDGDIRLMIEIPMKLRKEFEDRLDSGNITKNIRRLLCESL